MKTGTFRFKKRYILVALILLLVILVAGFFTIQIFKSGAIRFGADTVATISNTATLTYQDAGGNNYSANSNQVNVQIDTAGAVDPIANITFSLQARSSAAVSGATLKIFNAGTQTEAIPAKTGLSSAGSPGTINNIDMSGMNQGSNYDFYFQVNSYIVSKIANKTITAFPLTLAFGELKGGDLNGSGTVDALDYSDWKSQKTSADINSDGAINGSDFDILSSNWTT